MIKLTESGTYTMQSSDLNVKLNNGREIRSTCPLCREHRGHPDDASLCVNVTTGAGICHHCHKKFLVTDYSEGFKDMTVKSTPKPINDMTDNLIPLDETSAQFLKKRCINPMLASSLGVRTSKIHGESYLAFPFFENGNIVNVQYKRTLEKGFHFAAGGKMVPWNAECILRGDKTSPLYITEGMMDALALIQCGFKNVISVSNGSGTRMETFDAYRTAIHDNFTHIVFAGDTDKEGIVLRNKVREYFSDMDVCVVNWEWNDFKGKDANDMLMSGGSANIKKCINNAVFDKYENYSVATVNNTALINLYKNGMPRGKGIGLTGLDRIIKFLPGYMYVVTGYPGAGKSSMVNFITMRLLKMYKWKTLFCTPEKMPAENHFTELISLLTGKKFDNGTLPEDEFLIAMRYLAGNVMHIREDLDDMDKILKAAANIVCRHNIKVFVIDPFIYLQIKDLRGVSETTKINEMLKKIRMFARKMKVMVIVVAHPRKPNPNAEHPRDSQMLYEISGSSGFNDICDNGIILSRPDDQGCRTKVVCGKSRFSYLGMVGETELLYDTRTGRYVDSSVGKCGKMFYDTENWTLADETDTDSYDYALPF